jgi:acetylornithine/succinyldiaminopimelate/putrescine aminotransferase
MDRAFFCNSGAEAVEAAIKLARKARPRRSKIVVFERSFHGRTMGALSGTMQARYQDPFRPLLPGFHEVPFDDIEAAARAIDEDTAAVLIEPVQGEGGVRPAPAGALSLLRRACDRAGALLLLDEVQTGIGRTGTLFAFQAEGVLPDAVAVAKALAGGLPMGALLARGEAARAIVPGDHGSTFGGGPFVATVASAVLDTVLSPGFLGEVKRNGGRLGHGLEALAALHPGSVAGVRGRGLMQGLVLRSGRAADLVTDLQAHGLLATTAGKNVLRLLPPLIVSGAEIDEALAIIGGALARLAPPDGLLAGEA